MFIRTQSQVYQLRCCIIKKDANICWNNFRKGMIMIYQRIFDINMYVQRLFIVIDVMISWHRLGTHAYFQSAKISGASTALRVLGFLIPGRSLLPFSCLRLRLVFSELLIAEGGNKTRP